MAALGPITRLLVANRGEIAVRIARGAHRLGIDAVGVYSERDLGAVHTTVMDAAVALGGATAAESYLRADAVIDAARRSGCDAVHPGYGFLAENAAFARAVLDAGLIWVGPTPEQIELLGDKVAAKAEAVAAGVPSTAAVVVAVPSEDGDELPEDLPVPAMVKAAAGGGGRGMRVVRDRAALAREVASASREAEAAFGDGTVFVEPLIERGRHVEVQVLGDHHGNVVHLGERECSIQRRHQKVLEEAPSPGIDEVTRRALCDGAVALARRVGYHNAGTVEFLVGDDGTMAFLEVNTRLQVEHPVTEAVWGVDMVELQLRIAAGQPLPMTQEDLAPSGHAIEVRLVAEDPAAGWMPSSGTVAAFELGDGGDTAGIRIDAGVAPGSVVGTDYDSLLAKVVAHAPTRREAAARLGRALRTAAITGVRTNADALAAILAEPDFLDGDTTTAYLDGHPEVLASTGPTGDDRVAHLVAAVLALEATARVDDPVWGFAPSGWRNVRTRGQRRALVDQADGTEHFVEYRCTDRAGPSRRERGWRTVEVLLGDRPESDESGALAGDRRRRLRVRTPDGFARGGVVPIEVDGVTRSVEASLEGAGSRVSVRSSAGCTAWLPVPRFTSHDASEASGGPVSPLPGTVASVYVVAGDTVADGDLLVVVEAMKMEHRITAAGDAVVGEVLVAAGDRVDAGTALVTFTE